MVMLKCCAGCSAWHITHKDEEYYKCKNCGCETFTAEWILKHPEHPSYQKYLEHMKEKEENHE